MSVLLTVLLGCFAMNVDSCCNVVLFVLLCLGVFRMSCCTHNSLVDLSQNEGCSCDLVGRLFCVELCIDYGVVLFV